MVHGRRRITLAAAAALASALALGSTGSAQAASRWPSAAPTGVRVTALGTNGFTVVANVTANTTSYRLWVSRDKHDLWVSRLSAPSTRRISLTRTTPRFVVSGLPSIAGPYYYRLATVKDGNRRISPLLSTSLRPATPTGFGVVTSPGTSLSWSSGPATGFVVERATDAGFTTGRVVDRLRDQNTQFTPTGLVNGRTYWFRIRAMNGTTGSAWAPPVTATVATADAPVRFMTYNIMVMAADGSTPHGTTVAPWLTRRRQAAAALVRPANPDVIAVQEGSQYTGPSWSSPLQVDTFASALGTKYVVARTQGRPGDPDYRLTGSHIVYDSTRLAAVGNGGSWAIGDGKWAAFQLLRHRSTGAEFVAVSTHLYSRDTGPGGDSRRGAETRALVTQAQAYAHAHGDVPVVYSGDTASVHMPWHPNDAPGAVLRTVRAADAWYVAKTVTNGTWCSVNEYRRTPVRGSASVDRVFAGPGVGVRAWNQLLRVSGGQFVGVIPSDHNPVVVDLSIPYDPTP